MKAIFVDSMARTVTEVETDLTDAALAALLRGKGLIKGALGIWGGTMVVSVEIPGGNSPYFTIEGGLTTLVGNGVIFGASRTVDQVRAGIKFLTHAEGMEARKREQESATALLLGVAGMLTEKKRHERVTVPAKELPADIKAEITGETRAMLDILSDKLGGVR